MKKSTIIHIALALGSLTALSGANAAVPDAAPAERYYPYVNGYPNSRPANAPTATFVKGIGWYAHALTGISKPYPYSLMFLDNQGTWYTPFNHPGMPGYYDIRGWHISRTAHVARQKSDMEGMAGMSGMSGIIAKTGGAPAGAAQH